MTKNRTSADRQTIRVLLPDGQTAGSTYPRRAAGLVKKGRACYVNDFIIRLNMSDAIHNSEVIKMDERMNHIETGKEQQDGNKTVKLYFDARTWDFNKDCSRNVGERSFMLGPDGELAEAYMIGNWQNDWTEILSEKLLLPKYADCRFLFWLNGGENDRCDEVCRLSIVFDDDFDQRYTFNLNRNFIRPVKKLNGWELYEIPFRTLDNEYTQLRFVAQKAYMTVMAAKDAAAYEHLEDTPDPYESERPQRPNLIFADGFPPNNWYGTAQLAAKRREQEQKAAENASRLSLIPPFPPVAPAAGGAAPAFTFPAAPEAESVADYRAQLDEIRGRLDEITSACEDIQSFDTESLVEELRSALENAFADREEPELDDLISNTVDSVADTLNEAAESIQDTLEEISDQIEDLRSTLSDD